MQSRADTIRRHVLNRHIAPARAEGRMKVAVRAGDVVRDMGLRNLTPSVCSALGSKLFLDLAGVELLERRGPPQSTTTTFHYRLLDRAADRETMAAADDSRASPPMTDVISRCERGGKALYLVSCVKTKRTSSCRAKDFYVSDWFTKARAYAERQDCQWRILSAQYGLVHPETNVAPYEKTLNTMPAAERRAWARRVLAQLEPDLAGVCSVVFLAGQRYREHLEPALRARGLAVGAPMKGLSQGRQLQWLNEALRG